MWPERVCLMRFAASTRWIRRKRPSARTRGLFRHLDPSLSLERIEQFARHYGEGIYPGSGLGYSNGQLLLGFHHNVPDNTLPIFWMDEFDREWDALFPRYTKVY